MIAPPVPTSSVDEAADWVEWATWLEEADYSTADLVGEYKRGGGLDHEDLIDEDASARLEARAEDVFAELEARRRAAGNAYPFDVGDGYIKYLSSSPIYLFLLALSCLGKDAAPDVGCGARLFERVCAMAASAYIGGNGIRFGAPREPADLPVGFADALDTVCGHEKLNEGGPAYRSGISHDKDGGLDVLAWHHFPDCRSGKLILLGQCATGRSDVSSKLVQMNETQFQALFLERPWESQPVRAFFFPWTQPDRERWRRYATRGGLLFDRCRVAYYAATELPESIIGECRQWAAATQGVS